MKDDQRQDAVASTIMTPHQEVRSKIVFDPRKKRQTRSLPKLMKRFKRDRHKRTKVAVFRYAYYAPAFKYFIEQVLDCDYLTLPRATKRTMELGIQHSSDYVCTPFKHMMGDWIEALEMGADILVQVGGPCRLGYYGEIQEDILKDMGYDFTMLNFSHGIQQGYLGWAKEVLKMVNPDIAIPHGVKELLVVASIMERLDSARDHYMANAGFEEEKGSFKRVWEALLEALCHVSCRQEVDEVFRTKMDQMRALPLRKSADPIRIGIVGEFYTAIDENSNLELDDKLLSMGVELHRDLNFSNRYTRYNEPNLRKSIGEYASFNMGPTSTLTLAAAKKYAEEGFDGIIHAKCAGCTPEIDCMPVLRRISEDHHIPMLYLTYDTETSDTGLMTRLEAFYDMLAMKKDKVKQL